MKSVIIIAIAFVLLIPLSANGQVPLPPTPEVHQRILEEGYSSNEILYLIVLVVIAITIPMIFFIPKMRKKFDNYGEEKK